MLVNILNPAWLASNIKQKIKKKRKMCGSVLSAGNTVGGMRTCRGDKIFTVCRREKFLKKSKFSFWSTIQKSKLSQEPGRWSYWSNDPASWEAEHTHDFLWRTRTTRLLTGALVAWTRATPPASTVQLQTCSLISSITHFQKVLIWLTPTQPLTPD